MALATPSLRLTILLPLPESSLQLWREEKEVAGTWSALCPQLQTCLQPQQAVSTVGLAQVLPRAAHLRCSVSRLWGGFS